MSSSDPEVTSDTIRKMKLSTGLVAGLAMLGGADAYTMAAPRAVAPQRMRAALSDVSMDMERTYIM